MEQTAVAVERVPWGESSSRLNTVLLLSWCIHIRGGCKLLGTLVGVVTLDSTFKASNLGLVFSYNRHNIASSPWGSIVVVVVGLGRCTVEVVGVARVVVVVSSRLSFPPLRLG